MGFSNGIEGWCAATDLTHPLPSVICLAASPASSAGKGATTLFAGTSRNAFRSTDNGTSWTQSNPDWLTPYNDYWIVWAFAISGTNIFAQNYYGPYRSTDNGETWTLIGGYLFRGVALTASRTCLFGTTVNGSTLRSTDKGISWDTISCPGSLAIIDTSLFA